MNAPVNGNDTISPRRDLWQPAVGASRGAFLCLPAMGVRTGFYAPLATALSAQGFDVMVLDHRATGALPPEHAPDFGYRELVHEDLPAGLDRLRQRFPDRPTYLLGHSLGGHVAALHLGFDPRAFDATVLVACGAIDHRGYPLPRRLFVLAGTQLAAAIARGLGYFPGHRLGFGGRQPTTLIRDWARHCRTGRHRLAGSPLDYDALMARAEARVLALSIAGDSLSPMSSTERLVERLERADVSLREVAIAPGGEPHFQWARHPEPVVASIVSFLEPPPTE